MLLARRKAKSFLIGELEVKVNFTDLDLKISRFYMFLSQNNFEHDMLLLTMMFVRVGPTSRLGLF